MTVGKHVDGGRHVGLALLGDFQDHSARHADGGSDEITQDHPFDRLAVAADTTVSDPNRIVACTSDSITVTLASSMVAEGNYVIVKDESGTVSGIGNAITIATEGSETIDGGASLTIDDDFGAITVYSDGSNWFTLSVVGAII